MLARNRKLTVFVAATYLMVVTGSALFHNHSVHGEGHVRPGVSASHVGDDHECSVCQFLAQKPAPTAEVERVVVSALVQEIGSPAPASVVAGVFTAWQSRAPPVLA